MRALLILVVLCVIGWFWMKRTPSPPPAARAPAIERPVNTLDPKAAIDRAKAAADKAGKARQDGDQ